jgi:ribosome-binding protein aMBF1 (putative translation factor)
MTQAQKFREALRALTTEKGRGKGIHQKLKKAQVDAMRSQLAELETEIQDYEALQSGTKKVLDLDSFDEFPRALIEARIAAHLSQRELADRLGLKEQQIQRYEATDYASASFSRMKEVVKALGMEVKEQVVLAK